MSAAKTVYELSRAILGDKPGVVAVIKAYMDESGTHKGSPVVTVGAYVAHSATWRDWTKNWNRQKRPIKVFHATDCAALAGEFEGWSAPQRDEYVKNLLPVIGGGGLIGHAAGIRMDDFRSVASAYPELARVFSTPYTACFQWVIQEILTSLNRVGAQDRVAFFHEENDFQKDALDCFSYLRERYNSTGRVLSLTFGGKADYTPLQAADTLAYEANKRLRNVNSPDRRSWGAMNPNKDRRQLKYFDRESLTKFAEFLKRKTASEARLS
ncbi:MAG TPA: DUF3800 domain-containing protein [Rhizomicrobium sp.]|nr:DUF3800 domain-containing protein [Rhizomicrobium sp.]